MPSRLRPLPLLRDRFRVSAADTCYVSRVQHECRPNGYFGRPLVTQRAGDRDLPKPSIVRLHEVRRPGDVIAPRTSTNDDRSRATPTIGTPSAPPWKRTAYVSSVR